VVKDKIIGFLKEYTVLVVVIVVGTLFSIGNPNFIKIGNIITILRQVSILGIIGIGCMFVVITGGINLAVSSIVSMDTVLIAILFKSFGIHWAIGMFIAFALSTLISFVMGLIIVKSKINPMIGTLAAQTIIAGLAYIFCNGIPVFGMPEESKIFGQGFIGPIPIPVVVFVVIALIVAFVFYKTYFGRYFFAAGSNDEAARLSGINTGMVRVIAYTLSGALCGIAGIIMYGRVGSGQPQAGMTYDMNALIAIVIGGVSFAGGEGKVGKVCIGLILIGMLTNGMTLNQVTEYVQMVIRGLIFLGAVLLDAYQHMPRKKKITAGAASSTGAEAA
jgi:ribose/xylose/arabinose/galactoside ABC-type transport system permease subunit